MQQTFHPHPFSAALAQCEPTFKLFIACEDNAAFFQARKVEGQVRALCGADLKVSRVFWSFSLLRHVQLRQHAVKEAGEAQLIIVSLSKSADLPGHVKSLLESLPVRAETSQAALVALVDLEENPMAEAAALLPYLRRIADARGLDFFCNKSGWERLDFSKPVFEPVPNRGLAPANIISYHIPWSSGGIND
jgi:hypothetical protein